ncbi:hypothetical protein ACFFX1_06030 [Dactylosporangium sucinum]|uniref:Uncharacterized protein n=1 Tax=Dactylosporangium sucinum TaxID=1424081 RepID=A0A917UFB9_9ACTN|nr:hypothetical protein [Dactylosporangium sucinum]GGM85329.1 hypothetical protein GCM10007977_103830 [Dactylosporangium sucinum]
MPAVAVALAVTAGLRYYGVSAVDTASFAAYVGFGIVVPGTLLWRAARGRPGWLVEDAAAGLAVGYGCEVLVYIAARAAGLPLLTPAWAAGTIGLFLAVPRLRRYWRRSDRDEDRTPVWWSAVVSGTAGVLFYWSCVRFFRTHALAEPGMLSPDADSPFHLALIGDAKHHMPLMSPWLADQPVLYHWFVYAELAATSWATGIEPHVLLVRLGPLPMLFGLAALVGVLGRRLTGRWWAAATAVVITFFVLAPLPYHWPLAGWFSSFGTNAYEDGSSLRAQLWTSPTQTFGAVLFAGLVLALLEALRRPSAARWALVVLLVVAVTGGKATFIPMLLAGLLLVIAVQLLARRHVHPGVLAATGLTLLAMLFAQFVLFGGASQGMTVDPLHFAQISGAPYTAGFARQDGDHQPWRLLVVLALTLVCWACIWPGLAGLARLRARPGAGSGDPTPLVLVLGIGLSGVAALLLLGHEGGAEGWFMVSGRPYLSLAAAAGLALLTPEGLPVRRTVLRVVAAVAGGGLVLGVVHVLGPQRVPRPGTTGSVALTAWALIWPYLVSLLLLATVAWLVRRTRWPEWRTLVVALLAGACLATSVQHLFRMTRESARGGWRGVAQTAPFVTPGTRAAGHWLRDHSAPDDLVATNAHCVGGPYATAGGCDNRHFWFAAYAERRFLVEGWGFTAKAHEAAAASGVNAIYVPYWDPSRLADNDAAFRLPSAQTIGVLGTRYHVRWLMVDETDPNLSPRLGDVAKLRFRSESVAIYQVGALTP